MTIFVTESGARYELQVMRRDDFGCGEATLTRMAEHKILDCAQGYKETDEVILARHITRWNPPEVGSIFWAYGTDFNIRTTPIARIIG